MTAGRPLQFDPENALNAAMHIFWEKGYEATSTSDLMKAMKLSKSSLYQTFGSKKKLFMSCLDLYCKNNGGRERTSLEGRAPDKAFIVQMLYSLSDPDRFPEEPKGCLLVNSTLELGKRDEEVGAYVNKRAQASVAMFEGVIRRAQVAGEIESTKDPIALANMLLLSVHGLKAMAKLDVDKTTLKSAVDEILHRLD